MFIKKVKNIDRRVLVRVIADGRALSDRLNETLGPTERFHIETLRGPIADLAQTLRPADHTSLLIVELSDNSLEDFTALERIIGTTIPAPPVIVVSDELEAKTARALVRLQVADFLTRNCSDDELLEACEHALAPAPTQFTGHRARCVSFLPAIGGAGATTLAIANLSELCTSRRLAETSCCIVDLNLQSGSVSDYLDVEPRLDIHELVVSPERLDEQLLEVMLSRHKNGFAVLAAPPSLRAFEKVHADLPGRLLDLASAKFDHVIVDMPQLWMPWSESVVRGTDDLFIVTDMTVTGMRQAKRVAEQISERCQVDTSKSIIVNKSNWLGSAGVKKQHAIEMLGDVLAGFVPDVGMQAREAQNRGVPLAEFKRKNGVTTALRKILARK